MTQTYIPCPNCRDHDKEGNYDRCMSWHLYQVACRPLDDVYVPPQGSKPTHWTMYSALSLGIFLLIVGVFCGVLVR